MLASLVLIALAIGSPTRVSSQATATSAAVNGTILAHLVGCTPEKGGRVVEYLNNNRVYAVEVNGENLTLTVPQGYDSISVSVGYCRAVFDALALSGSKREVVVVADPGTADRPCCETDDIYVIPGGHLMGRLPPVSGLSVHLVDAKGKEYVADVQHGTYYFDFVGVGHYELRVEGQNWYKVVREIDVTDTDNHNRSSLIIDLSSADSWGGTRDEF